MTALSPGHQYLAAQLTGDGAFGITGPAGSGKTFAAKAVAAAGGAALYSTDLRFIGDSRERRELLERKQARSVTDYSDSANQYNWWDWASIQRDVGELAAGRAVTLDAPYDRESGKQSDALQIAPARTLILEGAILGPPQLVDRLRRIFFICTPAKLRFDRLLQKDSGRRSFNDILARFLITEYSETIYYQNLFSWARERITFIDGATGHPCAPPDLPADLFVPLRMSA